MKEQSCSCDDGAADRTEFLMVQELLDQADPQTQVGPTQPLKAC